MTGRVGIAGATYTPDWCGCVFVAATCGRSWRPRRRALLPSFVVLGAHERRVRACGQAGRWSNVGCETPASAGSRGPPQSVPLRAVSQPVRDFRIALALLTPAVLSAQWSTSWRAGGAVEPPSPQWSCSVTLRRHQLPGGALLSTRWSGRRSGGESSLDQCNCAAGKPWCAVAQQSCVACGAGWRMFRSRPHEITVRHAGSCSGYWCCSASRGG